MALEIFCSYAHKDERLFNKLKTHLRILQRQGLIDVWYDRDISAGTDWAQEIDKHLCEADIILLLVSPDFMDSDYCYSIEMQRAIERYEQGEACVIPIILRPVYWQGAPFSKLQALPKDGKPIKRWYDQDEAFREVTLGILKAIDEIIQHHVFTSKQQKKTSEVNASNSKSTSLHSEPPLITNKAPDQLSRYSSILQRIIREELGKKSEEPLKVSIMGQAGVGKSTLLNMLYKTDLSTDLTRPETSRIETIHVKRKLNRTLIFYDLPGIGQSLGNDQEILKLYKETFLKSDIAIWAIHADSGSFAVEYATLIRLLETADQYQQSQMMSKIIFVLTKVDLLASTISSPWIFHKQGSEGVFVPTEPIELLIKQKETYFRDTFIAPFKHLIVSRTYYTGKFRVSHPHIHFDEHTVYYAGYLEEKERERLKDLYPQYADIFDRLYDNYRIIPCSSKFRYNLDLLINVIIQKLGVEAVEMFKDFVTYDIMSRVPVSEAKRSRNIVLFDTERGIKFDLNDVNF